MPKRFNKGSRTGDDQAVAPKTTKTGFKNLEGICNKVQSQKPSNKLLAHGTPSGASVPVKVKNKIWANNYVDLLSLLPSH